MTDLTARGDILFARQNETNGKFTRAGICMVGRATDAQAMKHIVTEGGGEYANADIKQRYHDHGIQRTVIAPSYSQLN